MYKQENITQQNVPTAWTGWVIFAAFMMGVAGLFQMIAGLTALFKQGFFVVGEDKLVWLSYTQWGWTHLLIGLVVFLSAFSLAAGQLWGRILGVTLATLSAVANFVFLPAYPLWSILIILVDILVIYSIVMHGSELREPPSNV